MEQALPARIKPQAHWWDSSRRGTCGPLEETVKQGVMTLALESGDTDLHSNPATRRRKWQPTPVILAWKIPWTEEPGALQSMGSQRVRHNWTTKHLTLTSSETSDIDCSFFHPYPFFNTGNSAYYVGWMTTPWNYQSSTWVQARGRGGGDDAVGVGEAEAEVAVVEVKCWWEQKWWLLCTAGLDSRGELGVCKISRSSGSDGKASATCGRPMFDPRV